MARRRLTLKRIDPWSVLKFGFVVNLALLAIWLLGTAIIWFFVRRLGLIESVCDIARDVGFVECGVNGGNLFRALLLLGLLGTVIQTGLLVFLAFLHNLIADLVGGLSFTFNDESAPVTPSAGGGRPRSTTARQSPPPPLGTEGTSGRSGASTGSSPPVGAGAPAGAGGPPNGPGWDTSEQEPASATSPPSRGSTPTPPRPPEQRPQESPSAPERRSEPQPQDSRPESERQAEPRSTPQQRPTEQPTGPGGSSSWDLFGPRGGSSGSGS